MTTVSHDSQPDWNQGWQDVVIGLAVSFAFIQAITVAVLLENRPAAIVTDAPTPAGTLVAKVLSAVLPLVLAYGMYVALAVWTYRAHTRMLASGRTSGVVYGRTVRSPYRLGSVLIFWATVLGLLASNVYGNAGNSHAVEVTATILRLTIGIACAWLAVFIRHDIDALLARDRRSHRPERDQLMFDDPDGSEPDGSEPDGGGDPDGHQPDGSEPDGGGETGNKPEAVNGAAP